MHACRSTLEDPTITVSLGFPRIGQRRELKQAQEAFWAGTLDEAGLRAVGARLRERHWRLQHEAGIAHIPSNDFSFYDQVLDTIALVGAVPERFLGPGAWQGGAVGFDTYFAMARGAGHASCGHAEPGGTTALAMTKWFDTNYHYLVPELRAGMAFRRGSDKPVAEFREALALGIRTRPVLLGPVSFLQLGVALEPGCEPLALLDALLPVYEGVLRDLAAAGAEWVQIDEPCLVGDLPPGAAAAYRDAYARLSAVSARLRLCLTTYFGALDDNLPLACSLPVAALHIDLVRAPQQLEAVLAALPDARLLSLGLIDGRNVWRTDLDAALALAQRARQVVGDQRLMLGTSCSLLHSPVDLAGEDRLPGELRSWLAFATQKLAEVALLARALGEGEAAVAGEWSGQRAALAARRADPSRTSAAVQARLAALDGRPAQRTSAFPVRHAVQRARLALPLLPTTTIGSFPQTAEVRAQRAAHRAGRLDDASYERFLRDQIADAVRFQEEIGIDVLVHGEFERVDMVEYFGEQLAGFAFTANGWVQSYGSRCVKPPLIYGDVARPRAMTVEWSRYAQSLTTRPMKGMLTGPVTVLQWSFVRDDQPRSVTCRQIALALGDEVTDLEAAGIAIIQVDEPALREGLPLRRGEWADYLSWAVTCFRLATCGVRDETQIHTHMCYSEFNDIMAAIADLDADVISIETARSRMGILDAFEQFRYPNEIGPGVFDIHSPRVPSEAEMAALLRLALRVLRADQVWVNPDCGLKTRTWAQVRPALAALVGAARTVRGEQGVAAQSQG